MVKSAPASSFKMTQPEFLFQLFIVTLDDPAVFGKVDEIGQRQVCGKSREPVFRGFTFFFRPFDQKPFLLDAARRASNRDVPGAHEPRQSVMRGRL